MLKNNICLGGAGKQNALVSESAPPKNAPMSSISRIGPVRIEAWLLFNLESSLKQ